MKILAIAGEGDDRDLYLFECEGATEVIRLKALLNVYYVMLAH